MRSSALVETIRAVYPAKLDIVADSRLRLAHMSESGRYPLGNDASPTAPTVGPCQNIAIATNNENVGPIVAVDVAEVKQGNDRALVKDGAADAVYRAETLPGVLIALACISRTLDDALGAYKVEVGSSIAINIGNRDVVTESARYSTY